MSTRLFGLAVLLVCCCLSGTAAPPPASEAKLVGWYALTSANDFPQRDPQDWRLLGSNDRGQTWTTLDIRKGEVFAERHQRRLFKVSNPSRFGLYRLQIDRVRTPAAADSVQLAEIEPLGENEADTGPLPIFADRVSAQGQKPPLETAVQLFDGQPETKWLDHANQNPSARSSWVQWEYAPEHGLLITNVAQLLSLRSRAASGYAVNLQAVVVGGSLTPGRIWLLDDTGAALAETGPGEVSTLASGARVALKGISRFAGQQVEVGQCEWRLLSPAPVNPRKISVDENFGSDRALEWVAVEGKAQFYRTEGTRRFFEIQDKGISVLVQLLEPHEGEAFPSNMRVRARGLCVKVLGSRGEQVPGTIVVPTLASVAPMLEEKSADPHQNAGGTTAVSSGAPVLESIEEIRRLSPEQLVRWPKVKVRGVVTELFGACIQEGSAGVEVWYGSGRPEDIPGFGMAVEVEGRGDWALGHGPIVRADRLTVLGKGKLPEPDRCSWSQLASGNMVNQWVEIEGVVRSTDGSHLLLSCEGGQLMATIRSGAAPVVRGLVDGTLRIRGVCVAASDSRGRMQGVQLLVPSLAFVEVEQAPREPFTLPARRIGSLLQVRGPKEFIHRVKVEGVLTYRDGRNYFLQDDTGAAMAIGAEQVVLDAPSPGWSWLFWQTAATNAPGQPGLELQPGDRLEAVGFPEMRGYSPLLTEVLVRRLGTGEAVKPHATSVKELESGTLDSTVVSLEAVLLRQQTVGLHYVLELQSDQHTFQALLAAAPESALSLGSGSRLRVTGVCQVEPLPFTDLGKGISSFKLLVRSPRDVTVLQRAPWWTLKRALVSAGTLLVILALAGAWIASLRRQVGERTKALQREIAEHERTEAQLAKETRRVQAEIEERKRIEAEVEKTHKQLLITSRLAGMTEVATSVLHNVGNVLNSANVLASLIMEHVQQSKASSVSKLAGLLDQHRGDLGRFVTEDGRGKELPGYLARLGRHLSEEQGLLLQRVRALTESIQHIKEIVATQQNYAKVSGLEETLPLSDIVEDALRIHSGALARHQIQLTREFRESPPVTLDRHKVLQILFNLLENAKHACEQSSRDDKQVKVLIEPVDNSVRVQVVDNGVGIARENLGRIFGQGFSTRKDGHGFGLHSSILAAQEMGATLQAESEGPGKGATFSLVFPAAGASPQSPELNS